VGIVFKAGDKQSTQAQAEILSAFRALSPPTVHGLPIRPSAHAFKDAAALAAWITSEQIKVLYVAPGLGADLEPIRLACREKKVVSMAGVRSFVEQALAVGVVVQGASPKILVNLPTAEAVGMELDAKLLQLAEVMR
jgi:hypothetical protein